MGDRSASPEAAPPPADGVTWRKLRKGLWVGRSSGAHLGVIEQGRRFTFTDADERSRRGFPTLSAAQSAATEAIPVAGSGAPTGAATPPPPRILVVLPPRSIGLLALAAAVLAATCGVLLLV